MAESLEVWKVWAACTTADMASEFTAWREKRKAQMVKYFMNKEASCAEEQKKAGTQVKEFLALHSTKLLDSTEKFKKALEEEGGIAAQRALLKNRLTHHFLKAYSSSSF